MTVNRAHAGQPPTLAGRVRQLNDSLQQLALRLKDAIATAVSGAVGEAVRDAVRAVLGARAEGQEEGGFDRPEDRPYRASAARAGRDALDGGGGGGEDWRPGQRHDDAGGWGPHEDQGGRGPRRHDEQDRPQRRHTAWADA